MEPGFTLNRNASFDHRTSQELPVENDHPLSSLGKNDELAPFSLTGSNMMGFNILKPPTSTIKVLLVSLGVIAILSATFFLISFLVFQLSFFSPFVIISLITLIVSALFVICLLGEHCHSSCHHIAKVEDGVLDMNDRKLELTPTSVVLEDEPKSLERVELPEPEKTIEEQIPAVITSPDSLTVTKEMIDFSSQLVEQAIRSAVSVLEEKAELLSPVKEEEICQHCLNDIQAGIPLESIVTRNSSLLRFFPHYIYSFTEEKIVQRFRGSISLFLLEAKKTKEKYYYMMTVLEKLAKKSDCSNLSQKYLALFLVCKDNFYEFHSYQQALFDFHEIHLVPIFQKIPPPIEDALSMMESFLLLWNDKKYGQQWSPTAPSYIDFMSSDTSFLAESQEKNFHKSIKVRLQETPLLGTSREFPHLVRRFIDIICSPVVQERKLSQLMSKPILIPPLDILIIPERELIAAIIPIQKLISTHQQRCYIYLKHLNDEKNKKFTGLRENMCTWHATLLDLHLDLWFYWNALKPLKKAVTAMETSLYNSLSLSSEDRGKIVTLALEDLLEDGKLSVLHNKVLSAGVEINDQFLALHDYPEMAGFFEWVASLVGLPDISQIVTSLQTVVKSIKK